MFRTAEVEAIVRNDAKMRSAVIRKGGMALVNGSKLEQAIMSRLSGLAHDLKIVATELGFDYDTLENTYYLGVSKGEVRCYAPRMVLRQGTLKLRWGNQYRSITELQQTATVIPNVLVDKKYTKVSLPLCTPEGYELVFRIYPKGTLNTAQLMKLLQGGGDWSAVLEPERPTDIRHTVTADKTEFQFLAVGYRTYTSEGKTKDGREFSIDKMVMLSDEGDEYELKAGTSRQAVAFAYWGQQASEDDPVRVTVMYDGLGDYNGSSFQKVNINYNPVNNTSSLADLLDLDDDYEDPDSIDNDYV